MQFSVYQESYIGGRKVNQDRMGYSYTRDALLLVLADGMGGHAYGEIAASVALQTISALFQRQATPYLEEPRRFLEEALLAAHRDIHTYRDAHDMSETPRTTIVVCLIQHDTATWAHCGDSRLYWMRDGRLLERTRDHSHIESLIAKGVVPASERATHRDRNKLYNCLGANSLPRVEVASGGAMLPGDQMLLCSDGLWSMLPDDELVRRMHEDTLAQAVPDLLRIALGAAGEGSDNVTALAILWRGGPAVDDMEAVTAAEISVDVPEDASAGIATDISTGMPAGVSAPASTGMSTVMSTRSMAHDLHSTTIQSAPARPPK
jgi:serine/threonine protein phosphatase PrpC